MTAQHQETTLPFEGPQIVFFSGGSALRALSHELKRLTHNSVHIVTPFDSGGSSAKLRDALHMPAVGDLRNRLMALADETEDGNPETCALFSHRLPADGDAAGLRDEVRAMIEGRHPLVAAVPPPFRRLVRSHLQDVAEALPATFDLTGASVGNLILAGGYISSGRDLATVLRLFSEAATVRGVVMPVVDDDCHLVATLTDGSEIIGQHRITGRDVERAPHRITDLRLVGSLTDTAPVTPEAPARVLQAIRSADLVVLPMGSFWTSVVANLLPVGVGAAIADADCRKVHIPNAGFDSEQIGMTTDDCVRELADRIASDAGRAVVLEVLPADLAPADLAALLVSLA